MKVGHERGDAFDSCVISASGISIDLSWEGLQMRRLLLVTLATIPLTGCQFFKRNPDAAVINPLTNQGDNIAAAPNGTALTGTQSEAFENPVVKAQTNTAVAPDLIRSTDPDARARQVQRSRVDPFAALAIPPVPEVVVTPESTTNNNARGSGAAARAAANGGAASSTAANRAAASARPQPTPPPARVQPNNRPLVTPSPIAALPRIPQPVIAPTVSVSGIVQLGNEPYAILRAGNEPERYVRVGDRIAGGSVRVKRIETLAYEPRVILEENGIEVPRPVSAESRNEPEPVAARPVPVPVAALPVAPVATPPAATQAMVLPALPMPTPAATLQPATLRPAMGSVPDSLLLQPAEEGPQAVLPGFQVAVPRSV